MNMVQRAVKVAFCFTKLCKESKKHEHIKYKLGFKDKKVYLFIYVNKYTDNSVSIVSDLQARQLEFDSWHEQEFFS